MAGSRVAVEVEAAGGLEDAAQLHQAGSHHHQVGHHGVAADELAEGGYHVLHRRWRPRVQDDVLLEGAFRFQRPLPGVGESLNLGWGVLAGLLSEQHVVGGVGVEGRVQVHQVNRLVGYILPQYLKVVAVVKGVGHGCSPTASDVFQPPNYTSTSRQQPGHLNLNVCDVCFVKLQGVGAKAAV